jgi:hypothetical protein
MIKEKIPPERKEKWDKQIHFLREHSRYLNRWEAKFVDSMELLRSEGKNLRLQQSFKLNEICHKVERKAD